MNYRDTIGHNIDVIPAMNVAPAVTDSIIALCKAALERIGVTPVDADDAILTILGQRDDLVSTASTASLVSLLRSLIQESDFSGRVLLADYDNFDVADADANTERWDVGYLNGTEGGNANINTTTAGKLMTKVDPDATPTAAAYGVHLAQPIVNKYFSAIADVNSTFGTPSASWATVGIRVSPTTYDANNVVYLQRQNSTAGVQNRIAAGAIFATANQGEVYVTTSDSVLAFKIERLDNVWRLYYSLVQYPDYTWVLITQYEDSAEGMDAQQSVYLDAYSPGTLDAETAQGDFDNFKLYESIKGLSQEISGDYDSSVVAADEDGSLAERLEQIQEAINRGAGTSIAAGKSIYDIIGATYVDAGGGLGTDSVVSDLGLISGLIDTAEAAGPYSYTDAGGEQDVYEDTATTRRRIWVEFSNRNMVQTGTFRIYRKVDGANYDLWISEAVLVAAGSERSFDAEFTTNQHWKLTYQENVDETAARNIPYNVISQVVE